MRIEEESRQPSHMSYKEYKRKVVKNKKHNFMMFVSIFFVLLLIFLGFAKLMSPDVDITIGDNSTQTTEIVDDNNYTNMGVDNRLKAIQEEDATAPTVEKSTEEEVTEDAGLVKIPEKTEKISKETDSVTDSIVDEPVQKHQKITANDLNSTAENNVSAPSPATPTPITSSTATAITARVVVGFYNTQAQAEVARGILQESGLGVTPHIRPMGAGYTLQAGAFSSKESANNLANKLLMNNYPARVIIDSN